jgi:GrpB-like predicted nucleotidyltransferase (UPF0157 family)
MRKRFREAVTRAGVREISCVLRRAGVPRYLRAHRDVAAEYGELKRRLAEEFTNDREAYTEAKGEFVRAVVGRARR